MRFKDGGKLLDRFKALENSSTGLRQKLLDRFKALEKLLDRFKALEKLLDRFKAFLKGHDFSRADKPPNNALGFSP
jgi:hypothetical protein